MKIPFIVSCSLLVVSCLVELYISNIPFIPYIKSNPACSGIFFVISSLEIKRKRIGIMIRKRSLRIYSTKLSKIILTIGFDKVHLIFYDKLLVYYFKHTGDIQDHIIRDIFEHKAELIIIEHSPESSPMLIKSISSVWFKIVFVGLYVIGNEIGTITGFEDFTTDKTLDIHHRSSIKKDLDVSSWFHSTQLRLSRKIKIEQIVYKKISMGADNQSLIRQFYGIHFYHRRNFKIFFDPADKLDIHMYISIEIDSRTLESNLFTIRSSKRMSIIRKIIIYDDLTDKRKRCSQSIHHIFLRTLRKSLRDSHDHFDQEVRSYAQEDKSKDNFCIYYFLLPQLSYNHKEI